MSAPSTQRPSFQVLSPPPNGRLESTVAALVTKIKSPSDGTYFWSLTPAGQSSTQAWTALRQELEVCLNEATMRRMKWSQEIIVTEQWMQSYVNEIKVPAVPPTLAAPFLVKQEKLVPERMSPVKTAAVTASVAIVDFVKKEERVIQQQQPQPQLPSALRTSSEDLQLDANQSPLEKQHRHRVQTPIIQEFWQDVTAHRNQHAKGHRRSTEDLTLEGQDQTDSEMQPLAKLDKPTVIRFKKVEDSIASGSPLPEAAATTASPSLTGNNFDLSSKNNKGVVKVKKKKENANAASNVAAAAEETKKSVNQTPINVFWNYVDGFFRPITEDDMKLLEERKDELEPFTIPRLGKFYMEQWAEEDHNSAAAAEALAAKKALQVEQQLTEAERMALTQYEHASGPLTQRLLAALLEGETSSIEELPSIKDVTIDPTVLDHRLTRQLKQLGMIDTETVPDDNEQDEICVELRILQRRLREQVAVNNYRKRVLAERVKSQLAWTEFYSILDELDKQIEIAFSKRPKASNKKRQKKPNSSANVSASHDATALIEKRNAFISAFQEMIPPRETLLPPMESIYDPEQVARAAESSRLPMSQLSEKPIAYWLAEERDNPLWFSMAPFATLPHQLPLSNKTLPFSGAVVPDAQSETSSLKSPEMMAKKLKSSQSTTKRKVQADGTPVAAVKRKKLGVEGVPLTQSSLGETVFSSVHGTPS